MDTKKLLKNVGINPQKPVLMITAEKALNNLLETIKEYCPKLKIHMMTKKEIALLLDTYADCVITYHPENHHQERAALLKNFKMLKKYGLTDDDYDTLDFC